MNEVPKGNSNGSRRTSSSGYSDPLRMSLLILLPIMVATILVVSIVVSINRPMTPLESILLNLMLFGCSAALAFLIARRAEGVSILATQEKLGESALRRIDDLTSSCERLIDYVEQHTDLDDDEETTDSPLVTERFSTILRLLTEVQSTLESSAEDWRRILPDEFVRRAAARGKAAGAYGLAVEEMSGAMEATRNALNQIAAAGDQRAQEQGTQMGVLQEQIRAIEQKLVLTLEQIKAETGHPLPSSVTGVAKRAPKVAFEAQPISRLILGLGPVPLTETEIIEAVLHSHGEPKPSVKTVREYVHKLQKIGLIANAIGAAEKLTIVRYGTTGDTDRTEGS